MSATREVSDKDLDQVRKAFGTNGTSSLAGIGVAFRGKAFRDEADKAEGIILTTRWILACWFPIVPLGSYRIRWTRKVPNWRGTSARAFELISKEPLAWLQVFRVWAISIAIAGVVIFLFQWVAG